MSSNAILAGLANAEAESVIRHGTLVDLDVRAPIYSANRSIQDVYFPIDCVLSVVTQMENGHQIEVGTIGREGVSAIPLILGATSSANESYCQVPGKAIRVSVETFDLLKQNAKFQTLLNRYVQAYVNMLGQLAACNRLHGTYERCARWLLMTEDRVDSATISLTDEYLGMMLGTEGSGVTIAASTLQQAGFIRYSHGKIEITDRDGLEAAACECYAVAKAQFGSLDAACA